MIFGTENVTLEFYDFVDAESENKVRRRFQSTITFLLRSFQKFLKQCKIWKVTEFYSIKINENGIN